MDQDSMGTIANELAVFAAKRIQAIREELNFWNGVLNKLKNPDENENSNESTD